MSSVKRTARQRMFVVAAKIGGQVIGASDDIGATPKDRPTTPAEVAATIYRSLGIPIETELPGSQGRPIRVVDNGVEPIHELFA